jgi:hypothetical protein
VVASLPNVSCDQRVCCKTGNVSLGISSTMPKPLRGSNCDHCEVSWPGHCLREHLMQMCWGLDGKEGVVLSSYRLILDGLSRAVSVRHF